MSKIVSQNLSEKIDNMKNCINCNESINENDEYCRFCSKKQIRENELTAEDLHNLFEAWSHSYLQFPSTGKDLVIKVVTKFTTEELGQIFDEYLRQKVLKETELKKITMQITAITFEWAWICFDIGIEAGLKRISEKDAQHYCFKVSQPYRNILLYWILRLFNEKRIKSDKANSYIETINNSILSLIVVLYKNGIIYCNEVTPKGDGLEFYQALKNI